MVSFGGQGTMGYAISWGPSQEEEKRRDILNITLGQDQNQTLSTHLQFCYGAMRRYPEYLLMLQADQPREEEVRDPC